MWVYHLANVRSVGQCYTNERHLPRISSCLIFCWLGGWCEITLWGVTISRFNEHALECERHSTACSNCRRVSCTPVIRIGLLLLLAFVLPGCAFTEVMDKNGHVTSSWSLLSPVVVGAGADTSLTEVRGLGLLGMNGSWSLGIYSADVVSVGSECQLVVFERESLRALKLGVGSSVCWSVSVTRDEGSMR